MELYLKNFKLITSLIIFLAIFPLTTPVLSFTYPLSTTLGNNNKVNNNILVVEKNGIYLCDQSLNSKINTLHSFSEGDKISTETSLSKTIIKKTSIVILIFSNYKLYIVDTETGALLYKSSNKIITDEEPEYIDIAFHQISNSLYFIIGYIDRYNYLNIKYYNYLKDNNTLNLIGPSCSLNSVTRQYNEGIFSFHFQNKGLSCDYMKDVYTSSNEFFTCFIIGSIGSLDYLIPLTFKDQSGIITFINNVYDMDAIQVNNNKQIKSDTNSEMTISYVCYVTGENIGKCAQFHLDINESNYYSYGYFDSKITLSNNCRADIYGMKVSYIFENGKVLFSCSDTNGSLQVYFFGTDKKYIKYSSCIDIYGYSVIYLTSLSNYYIISDVTCPEGKIPYDILLDTNEHNPEYISVDTTNKEIILDSSNVSDSKSSIIAISEKMPETNTITESIFENEKNNAIMNVEKEKATQSINNGNGIRALEINDCPKQCLECNSQKKCTKCNKDKNYYPIELISSPDLTNPSQTVVCITEEIKQVKYPSFYLDTISESFKPCYETCATCYGIGDENNNNCITCDPGYILHPEYEDSKECVPMPNSFYYIKYGLYTITNSDKCPEDYIFLIEEKGKCIEDCKMDSKYIYTYDGRCFESPPENTNDEDGDFICKDNINKCILTKKKLYTLNDLITDGEIEILTLKYAEEYNYTNNHISIYENDIYVITIYKNSECVSELGILTKTIDFKTCYTDIKNKYSINQETNLIVVLIETKPGKEAYKRHPSYGLYHPQNGQSFDFKTECKIQKVTIQKNITREFNDSKVSLDNIRIMAEQGLDLFDPSCPFYNDLCTHYPDILNKDIPLNKRFLSYYLDIEFCDDNCQVSQVFLNNLTAKCECSISVEEVKKDINKDNSLHQNQIGELKEFIFSSNINVIKCYHDIFKIEYLKNCYGGIIILGLIVIQIFCILFYCIISRFYLKKFFYSITNKYINYLNTKISYKNIVQTSLLNKGNNSKVKLDKSPIGIYAVSKKQNKHYLTNNSNINSKNKKNTVLYENRKISINNSSNQKGQSKSKTVKKKQKSSNINQKLPLGQNFSDDFTKNKKDDLDLNIKEFLKTDPDDMDYDVALSRDKRSFCGFFFDKIKSRQIILNTFCYLEYLKPFPIKIILFVLQVELYFFINGLFYNEEYVTKIFELENDSFSKQAWRFLDNLFYAFLVGVIINYIFEFFFIQEKKLKSTLVREKDNVINLKNEMIQVLKDIQKRFFSFIIISFILSAFIWLHISCFNSIYKHMQKEWLIFSFLIIVCIQILSIFKSLIEAILRFLSFKCKSEKLFKLSLIFS